MSRIVVLGAAESGVGAAALAKVKGYDVFVSDLGQIKPHYKEILAQYGVEWEEGHHTEGNIYVNEVWPGESVFPDFGRKEVRDWWADHHKELLDMGVRGIWDDMNEPASFRGELPQDVHSLFDAASGAESGAAATGMKAGQSIAERVGKGTKGVALVVVAGMNYAAYVEAKGYNVLSSAEHLAERELPRMLDKLITNIKRAAE